MLFDITQFEQFFQEKTLKKGLKIFEKGQLHFIGKQMQFDYEFSVSEMKLILRKKGDKILSYTCTCRNENNCEHFAASLFYFQQEDLGIAVKKRREGKVRSKSKNAKSAKQAYAANIELNQSLINFIDQNKNRLSPYEIIGLVTDKQPDIFALYCLQLELLLEPFLQLKKLDQKSIDALVNTLSRFILRDKHQNKGNSFYGDLALVKQFILLFNLRYTGDEKVVFNFYKVAQGRLDEYLGRGLSVAQRKAWITTTLASLANNKSLTNEVFSFLIPRCLSFMITHEQLEEVERTLQKRTYVIPYSSHLDRLLIAKLQVALMKKRLFKIQGSLDDSDHPVESIIAEAELWFCKGNSDKAFSLLEQNYAKVKSTHFNYYGDYLDYIIFNARTAGNKELEVRYLKESFVFRLYIQPATFERFLELTPKKNWQEEIQALVKRLKTASGVYSFDKVALLLFKGGYLDELVLEIKKQTNKFTLLHEIALQKFPEYDKNFLNLYIKHLQEALIENDVYNHQVMVFNKAKQFLDKLAADELNEIIKGILDRIGRSRPVYRYINELQGFPFLKEAVMETNLPIKK